MNAPRLHTFTDGHEAALIEVSQFSELLPALRQLGLPEYCPVLVLVGGASQISLESYHRLQDIFNTIIAPLAEQLKLVVVDGGTDAGIMRLIGEARAAIGGTFPLVGVAASGTVNLAHWPSAKEDATPLAPHHSHFILVPGNNWGDESPWLARVSSLIAGNYPSITLVLNGGEITWQDVAYSVKEGRRTLILDGSGRTADRLAAAILGNVTDERASGLIASGLLALVDLNQPSNQLKEALETSFNEQGSGKL